MGWGATGKSELMVRRHDASVPDAEVTAVSFRSWKRGITRSAPTRGSPVRSASSRLWRPRTSRSCTLTSLRIERSLSRQWWYSAPILAEIEPQIRTGDGSVATFDSGSGHADPNATLFVFVKLGCTQVAPIVTGTPSG